MLKSTHTKLEPKILRNHSYEDFKKESLLQELRHELKNNGKFGEL